MSAINSHAQITDIIPFSGKSECKANDTECYSLKPKELTKSEFDNIMMKGAYCDENIFTSEKIQTLLTDYIEVSLSDWHYYYIATGCPFQGKLFHRDRNWNYFFYASGFILLTSPDDPLVRIYMACEQCIYDPALD